MSVKQISKIRIKRGLEENLPIALSEGEFGYTTDTGSVYIGAPNLEKIAYRAGSGNTNDAIFPYQNVKLLTEFDLVRTITGDYYIQGPLVSVNIPISTTPSSIYTFDVNINSISASFSLYDGSNVNMVGEMFISIFDGIPNICITGQLSKQIKFSGILNSNKQIELQVINTTSSQYTLYLNAKCWESNTATWDGTKGSGVSPLCSTDIKPYLYELQDVSINNPVDKQILIYDGNTSKWTNTSDTFISSSSDNTTDYQITEMGVEKTSNYLWVVGSMQNKIYFIDKSSFDAQTTNLNNEISRAKSAEDSLNGKISILTTEISAINSEISTINTSIQIISSNLSTEISRAKAAETNLSSEIGVVSSNLSTEASRAKAAETSLSNNISTTNANLTSEITRAKIAEANLSTSINTVSENLVAESNRAKGVEATKQDNLGFIPVQQGTGINQSGNTVKIGYDNNGGLLATVDNTNLGNIAFQSWVENYVSSQLTEIITNGNPGDPGSYTIIKTKDSSTPSGYRIKMMGQSQAFNSDDINASLTFPITLSGIYPGSWGVTTFYGTDASNGKERDSYMTIVTTPTVSSMILNCNATYHGGAIYPIYGMWWIEGW